MWDLGVALLEVFSGFSPAVFSKKQPEHKKVVFPIGLTQLQGKEWLGRKGYPPALWPEDVANEFAELVIS